MHVLYKGQRAIVIESTQKYFVLEIANQMNDIIAPIYECEILTMSILEDTCDKIRQEESLTYGWI